MLILLLRTSRQEFRRHQPVQLTSTPLTRATKPNGLFKTSKYLPMLILRLCMKAGNQICTQLTMKLFSKNVPPKVPIHFYHTSDKVQVQHWDTARNARRHWIQMPRTCTKDAQIEVRNASNHMADRNAGSPGAPSSNDENLKESVRLLLKKLESPAPAPSIIIDNNNGLPSPHQPLLSHQYSQTDSPDRCNMPTRKLTVKAARRIYS